MDSMLNIYLSGMGSGVTTVLMNFTDAGDEEITPLVNKFMATYMDDPAVMEHTKQQIREILVGDDSEPTPIRMDFHHGCEHDPDHEH